jgi:hypothetical protein
MPPQLLLRPIAPRSCSTKTIRLNIHVSWLIPFALEAALQTLAFLVILRGLRSIQALSTLPMPRSIPAIWLL